MASGTSGSLLLTNVTGANAGTYTVVASNSAGTATSQPAFLLVSSNSFPVLFYDNFDTDSSANWDLFWGADDNIAGLHRKLGLLITGRCLIPTMVSPI